MRIRATALWLLWGLLFLVFPERGASQPSQPACLEASPGHSTASWLPPSHPVQANGNGGIGSIYVSSSGEICRSKVFLDGQAGPVPQTATLRTPQPGKAFLLSAAVPGAGQWFLGQDRWPAYLAVELWAWIQFLDQRREGQDLRSDYKDLAWLVARRVSTGPRTDAGWDYYEALSKFRTSGSFDSDPLAPGIQPEQDPDTFNGSIWGLAQEIFLPEDPENPVEEGSEPLQKAYSYYLSRAYGPEFAWDWGSNNLHREEYAGLIREADEALRGSTRMVGVILANHLLSAVDALVSGRLGIAGVEEPSVAISLGPGSFRTQTVALHVRLPDPMAGHVP